MTDVKKQTIRLIHSGDSNMRIAALLNEEFGIPGHENEFYGPIEECRKEVATFRREAPGLALEAFKRGYSWPQVVAGLEARGLLHSTELISICVRARDTAFPKPEDVATNVEDLYAKGLTAQAIAEAEKLATVLENSTDPVVQASIDLLRQRVEDNRLNAQEQAQHDKKRQGELNGTIGKS